MSSETGNRSIAPSSVALPRLVSDLFKDTAKLTSQELMLLRAELEQKLNGMVMGAILLAAAGVFAVVALSLSVETLVAWLSILLQSKILATLLCSLGAALIAAALVIAARRHFQAERLKPRRFEQSVKTDLKLVLGRR